MVLKTIKNFIKKYWRLIIIMVLSIIFFIGTAGYSYILQKNDFIKWASPDETANYIFAKLYGQSNEISIFEKYNLYSENIIHPRSVRSDFGVLKPVSFLGIILIYGKIVSLTSYKILPFLTPFFASLGILFFYLIIKKIFGKKNAFLSSLILIPFPVYFYYSARSMFHNVLFVVLLMMSIYFLISIVKDKKRKYFNLLYVSLGGFFLGLTTTARTSELLWIIPMVFIIWIFNIKKIGFLKIFVFLSFLLSAIIPMLFWNQILYDSSLNGGYPDMNQSIQNITNAGEDLIKTTINGKFFYFKNLTSKIKDNIFYFGFNPKQSIKMFFHYFIAMFPLLFSMFSLGLILFFQDFNKWRKKHLVYITSYLTISLILLFYYGSWKFYDNPDKNSFTIGNSYTRYWLPIYLGAIPFASLFISRITKALFSYKEKEILIQTNLFHENKVKEIIINFFKKPRKKILIPCFQIFIIIIIYFFSLSFVLYGSEEGLIYSIQKNKETKYEYEKILELTESNSVIITKYHDKIFFPERKVIVGLFDDNNMNKNYAKIAKLIPVYYYNFNLSEDDLEYLNSRKLAEVNLNIKKIKQINKEFTLYKIYPKD